MSRSADSDATEQASLVQPPSEDADQFDEAIVRSTSHRSKVYHRPGVGCGDDPTPACGKQLRGDVDWILGERENIDGWRPPCEDCYEGEL